MWPCLARLKSFVAVGGRRCGKKVGFLLPIVNNLLDTSGDSGVVYPKVASEGPLVVVTCPTWEAAESTHEVIKGMCEGKSNP